MILALILVASILPALFTWYKIAGMVAWSLSFRTPGGGDIAFGILVGLLAAWAWPITLPVSYLIEHDSVEILVGTPRRIKRDRIERENKALARRNEQLERELLGADAPKPDIRNLSPEMVSALEHGDPTVQNYVKRVYGP